MLTDTLRTAETIKMFMHFKAVPKKNALDK